MVTRDDIMDFCDSIPQGTDADADSTARLTIREAQILGANSEQADAMNVGAMIARFEMAMSGMTGKRKSFQSVCRAQVREQLLELNSK